MDLKHEYKSLFINKLKNNPVYARKIENNDIDVFPTDDYGKFIDPKTFLQNYKFLSSEGPYLFAKKNNGEFVNMLLHAESLTGPIILGQLKPVDKVIYGNIYTGKNYTSAIAIRGSKIAAVGNDVEALIDTNTEIINIDNSKLITPALNDAHAHTSQYITAAGDKLCSFPNGATLTEIQNIISEYILNNPEIDYIRCTGWNDDTFIETGYGAEARLLDEIVGSEGKEIVANSSDGHSYWVNTKLMNRAGISSDDTTTPNPEGGQIVRYPEGHEKAGKPTGCFRDKAIDIISKVAPKRPDQAYKTGILGAEQFDFIQGYATRFQAGDNEQYDELYYPVLKNSEELDKLGELTAYTQGSFMIQNTDHALDMVDKAYELWQETKNGNYEMSVVKIYIDGVIENEGALLKEAYANNPQNYGTNRWTGEAALIRLGHVIAKANKLGMSVHFHGMGDQAIDNIITAIGYAVNEVGLDVVKNARNAIAHLALVSENAKTKMAEYNVIATFNPWCSKDGNFWPVQCNLLGETRALRQYPMKSLLNKGVKYSFGTDMGASFTFDSMECLHVLCTRRTADNDPESELAPAEKLTREEALYAMTQGAAYQMKKEDEFGTLEVGKDANIVIFSKDILAKQGGSYVVPDDELFKPNSEGKNIGVQLEKCMVKGVWRK